LPLQPVSWSSGLLSLAQRFGSRVAVRSAQASLSFSELSARAHALAGRLAEQGITPGEPVALSLPNGTDVVWASYGITLHGAAETPMSPSLTADEVAWFAGLAGARSVVTQAARRDFFAALGMKAIAIEDLDLEAPCPHSPHSPPLPLAPVPGGLRGRILSSSGTTGKPKAIVYTHARRWIGHELLKSALPFVPQPGDRILLMTPFAHGASLLTYAWLDHGGEAVLLEDIDRAQVEPVLRGGVAAVFAPPTVINKLAELFPEERFAGVRCVFTGTQSLTEAAYRRAERMFGPVVRITYGKTECVNPITVLSPADTAACYESESIAEGACLGWPADGVELVVKDDSGTPLPVGASGEIWLRARHMAEGYIDAAGFHTFENGWHATGDLGWIDERGRLWLSGRLADVIKTGGYKVQPEEIEATLAGLPRCGQIVVAALPSDYWGEVIVAATEHATEGWSAEAQTRAERLSKHKRPRAYIELPALPRNPQGKISRREVRAAILDRYRLVDGPHPRLETRD
jgi:acyl-CoA synthetase (AMP-forming)/AMP-acid ligase II